jgi:hypothetical protein
MSANLLLSRKIAVITEGLCFMEWDSNPPVRLFTFQKLLFFGGF